MVTSSEKENPEKGSQKGRIDKSKSSNMQKMWNTKIEIGVLIEFNNYKMFNRQIRFKNSIIGFNFLHFLHFWTFGLLDSSIFPSELTSLEKCLSFFEVNGKREKRWY